VLPHHPGKQLPAASQRLAGLDHLRALAILLVFLYHYRLFGHPVWIERLGTFGWTGVDLFFVLSGYLIGGQLLAPFARQRPLSLRDFYLKRSFRILPAYLVVVLLYFTVPAFVERSHLAPLWKFLTFTQNFGLDLRSQGAFSHAWSLCIEEQFYLLLPFSILLLAGGQRNGRALRHAGWVLLILFVAGFGIRWFGWEHFVAPVARAEDGDLGLAYYKYIYYPTYNRLDGLLAGVALAALFHFRPRLRERLTRYGNAFFLLSLLLLTGAYFVVEDLSLSAVVFGFPLISLGYGVLVLAALSPSCFLYRYSSRLSTFVATLSYSLYLTHKGLIHLTHLLLTRQGISPDSYTLFWASAVVSVLGAWLLHLAIEKPFLRLRDKVLYFPFLPANGSVDRE